MAIRGLAINAPKHRIPTYPYRLLNRVSIPNPNDYGKNSVNESQKNIAGMVETKSA